MTRMVSTRIHGTHTLLLPEHRAGRPEWPWWEAARLSAEHEAIHRAFDRNDGHRPVVWCVGAEEGDMPALYSKWGADVLLIEPNPKVWPNIRAIWDANDLRLPVGWFVGLVGGPGMVDMDPPENNVGPELVVDAEWPRCAYGPVIGDHGFRALYDGRASTPTSTIDELWRDRLPSYVDIITMDVEGAELHVLDGATKTLRADRPDVFVSIHPDFMADMYGHTPADVIGFMRDHEYTGHHLVDDHESHWWFTPNERTAT